jgi:hypothetical protein
LVEGDGLPEATLAEHVAMVTAEDDDGVLVQTAPLEHVKELADAVVDVADSAIVRPPRPLDLLVAELGVPQVADLEQPLAVRVLLLLGDLDLGQLDVDALVQIPVLLFDGVRIVGVCQGNLRCVRPVSLQLFYDTHQEPPRKTCVCV